MVYKKRVEKEYALYKGDTFVVMGTIKEIAEKMGVSQHTIRFYHTPSYKKKNWKNGFILINVDEEE